MHKILKHFSIEKVSASTYCEGRWLEQKNQTKIASINPTTEDVLGEVFLASEENYEEVMAAAQKTFAQWKVTPAPQRGELIRLIADALRDEKDHLGTLISLEMGKSKTEGDGEVQEMIDIADFAVGQSRMLYGKTMHSERPCHRLYEQWHPLGVVGVISAFNFPAAVWAWNAFIAAICGNVVVWKPSSKTPLVSIAIQKICHRVTQSAGYPGVFSMFIGDNELATGFVDDCRVALLSFTGSTHVGRFVAERVGHRLGKSLLELGGNNAIILDQDADLTLALPAIVFGAVGTAGQRCTTTRRLLVHQSQLETVANQLVHAYDQVTLGDPLQSKHLMGPLIDSQAVDAFEKTMIEIKQQGGEILLGGNAIEGKGYFVEPTIVRAQNHWPVVQRETFAPILYLISYTNLDDAMQLHNSVSQGLSSAIFTQNIQHAEYFLSSIGSDCGIANVNIGTSGAEIGGAFGGEKDTGGGRESGSDAWKAYMRRQTNTINWSDDMPLAQGIKFDFNS